MENQPTIGTPIYASSPEVAQQSSRKKLIIKIISITSIILVVALAVYLFFQLFNRISSSDAVKTLSETAEKVWDFEAEADRWSANDSSILYYSPEAFQTTINEFNSIRDSYQSIKNYYGISFGSASQNETFNHIRQVLGDRIAIYESALATYQSFNEAFLFDIYNINHSFNVLKPITSWQANDTARALLESSNQNIKSFAEKLRSHIQQKIEIISSASSNGCIDSDILTNSAICQTLDSSFSDNRATETSPDFGREFSDILFPTKINYDADGYLHDFISTSLYLIGTI